MYQPLPDDAHRVQGVKLSDWTADPEYPHCAMRFIEGTDPALVANRVAFIEKTPRVRVQPFATEADDWRGWHQGWKGDDGWCEIAQGWCDTHLLAMGYDVPAPRPYDDAML